MACLEVTKEMLRKSEQENVFWGTPQEWLKTVSYEVEDVLDDAFALDFSQITVKNRMDRGESVEMPEFREGLPF